MTDKEAEKAYSQRAAAVARAAVTAAQRLNYEWPRALLTAPGGHPWPDGGWAMIRGLVIRLFYEELARGRGMRTSLLEQSVPELFMTFVRMRAELAEDLPEHYSLSPDLFGAVHEALSGFGLVDGEVVKTDGRRKGGVHFTPPKLASKIVNRAVAPLLECIESPLRILDLRICDISVGAGAFPLALVRELAPPVFDVGLAPNLEAAKRLVAVHCCYGVDKCRYAVLSTTLALTLECRADGMPADWLDENFRVGDALVGLDKQQFQKFGWKRGEAVPALVKLWDDAVDGAARARIARLEELSRLARENPALSRTTELAT